MFWKKKKAEKKKERPSGNSGDAIVWSPDSAKLLTPDPVLPQIRPAPALRGRAAERITVAADLPHATPAHRLIPAEAGVPAPMVPADTAAEVMVAVADTDRMIPAILFTMFK